MYSVCILLKVVSYYDLSAHCFHVSDAFEKKKFGWRVGNSVQFYLDFWNIFNFAKPLINTSPHHNSRHDDVAGVRSQRLILAVNDRLLDDTDVFAGRQEPLCPAWQLIVVLLCYQSRTEHLVADDTPTHGVLRYDMRTAADRHKL